MIALRSTIRLRGESWSLAAFTDNFLHYLQDACYRCKGAGDQKFGKTKGGRNSKLHAVVDEKGRLLDAMLMAGQQAEITTAEKLLGSLNKKVVLADKGYDSGALREAIWKKKGVPVIPGRSNRKKEVFYVREVGKRRHVVENYFARLKRFRRTGTRYDRLPDTFMSFVYLASAMDWIK